MNFDRDVAFPNKIRIIDLLNKIANGEEPKIKYDNFILKYNKDEERFIDKDRLNSLYEIDFSELNDEVEILDNEDENIEEINKMAFVYHVEDEKQNANNDRFKDFINILIDEVNKLKKEGK